MKVLLAHQPVTEEFFLPTLQIGGIDTCHRRVDDGLSEMEHRLGAAAEYLPSMLGPLSFILSIAYAWLGILCL